jgi:hypothetical protein
MILLTASITFSEILRYSRAYGACIARTLKCFFLLLQYASHMTLRVGIPLAKVDSLPRHVNRNERLEIQRYAMFS